MTSRWLLVLFLAAGAFFAAAQQPQADDLGSLLETADQWARENLDPNVLRAFESVDRDRIQRVLKSVHDEFTGDYVLDLAALKEGVTAILPLLEKYEETLPYALWLRTRLDYFEVASELDARTPAPRVEPGKPPAHKPNPSPKMQEEIWIRKVVTKPWPKAAQTLVPRLKPIFARANIPAELVWIAEVESSFDPRARSPEGATGLFQLMPETAKRFQLKTSLPDQRLNPEKSAAAAASYLSYLHGRFKDWRLAIAAYNCGEGRVSKLLAASRNKTYESIATLLPAETQLYVPKLDATLRKREETGLAQLETVAKKSP